MIIAIGILIFSAFVSTVRAQQNSASQSQHPATPAPQQSAPANPTPAVPGQPVNTIDNILVPGLDTEKAKVSYAIGMSIGADFKRQSVEVDDAAFDKGVRDALSGSSTLLTDEQARSILNAYKAELRVKQQEKVRLAGEANKQAGDAYLRGNQSKEGVVVLPSGLQYKILAPGTGPKPTATDVVNCNYRGTFIDGTEFDSSAKHGGTATFPVTGVIKGWTEALQLMPVGSKWQLFVPSDLAYGERGAPGGVIGPNTTLIFEVELVSINPKPGAQEPAQPATPAQPAKPAQPATPGSSPKSQ
jgi:FKBP-type peptidyl-prolyl cis-trans isomerase